MKNNFAFVIVVCFLITCVVVFLTAKKNILKGGGTVKINANKQTVASIEFDKLYLALQKFEYLPKNQIKSNSDYILDSIEFKAIVSGGNKFIPYIVEKLKQRDYFMVYAMEKITNVNIYNYMTNIKKIKPDIRNTNSVDWWLIWWEDNKGVYLKI